MEWVWIWVVNCTKIEILIKRDEQNTLHSQSFVKNVAIYLLFSGKIGKFDILACVKHLTNSMSVSLSLSLHSAPVSWREGKGQQTRTQDLQSPAPVKNVSIAKKKQFHNLSSLYWSGPRFYHYILVCKVGNNKLLCNWLVLSIWIWRQLVKAVKVTDENSAKVIQLFHNLQRLSNLSVAKLSSSEPYYSQYMRL